MKNKHLQIHSTFEKHGISQHNPKRYGWIAYLTERETEARNVK